MEIPTNYLNKFRPAAAKKPHAPRSSRDVLLEDFKGLLNDENKRDGYPAYTTARIAGMFKDRSESEMYALYQQCSAPGVKSFGAMLRTKLKPPCPPQPTIV